MTDTPSQAPGWYYAQGDPPGTQRYWDGAQWQGGPQVVPAGGAGASYGAGGIEEKLAGGGNRILARIIDMIIYFVVGFIFAIVVGGGTAGGVAFGSTTAAYDFRTALAGLLGGFVMMGYEIYMTANGGATLGKKALGIKITNDDGSAISLETAIKRVSPWLASIVAGIIPILGAIVGLVVALVGLVSLVLIFTDKMNKAVWDKIANTLVVKA